MCGSKSPPFPLLFGLPYNFGQYFPFFKVDHAAQIPFTPRSSGNLETIQCTHTHIPLCTFMTKKPLVNFFPAECPATTTHRVKWWCQRRGPFCFGLIALKLLWRISYLGKGDSTGKLFWGKQILRAVESFSWKQHWTEETGAHLFMLAFLWGQGAQKNLHYCFV